MVAAFAIRVEGLEALDRRLRELPPKIERKVLRTALLGTANKVATRLKAATPRRTGLTASRVRVVARVNALEGAFAKVSYRGRPAATIGMRERGTVRQPARPFFRQAISGWEQETIRDFQEALRGAVEGAESKLGLG